MPTLLNRKIQQGFLRFGSDDESIVYSNPLTSMPAEATAVGNGGSFSSGGMEFVADTDGIYFDMDAIMSDYTILYSGCTLTFWVESSILDAIANNEVLFSLGVSSTSNSLRVRHGANYWDIDQNFNSRFNISSVGKSEYSRWDFVFQKGQAKLLIDNLHASIFIPTTSMTAAMMQHIAFGFKHVNVSGGGVLKNFKIKDFQVSDRALSLPTHPKMLNVLSFGDSMPERGSYPHGGSGSIFAIEQSGQSMGGEQFIDAAMLPTIQRELAKVGMHIGRSVVTGQGGSVTYNAIKKYAVGGSAVDPLGGATYLEQAVDTALVTDKQRPDVVLIWIGSNDITNGWGSDATPNVTLDATWKALYDAQIDRLIAAGAKHVFVCNVVYIADTDFTDVPDVATGTALLESRQDTANALILEFETDIAEVTHVNLFTKFGGNNPIAAYYSTAADDRHLSALGSVVAGKEIERVIRTKIK